MSQRDVDRRKFHQLAAAALGGLVAGSAVGCGGGSGDGAAEGLSPPAIDMGSGGEVAAKELHLCRGLNTCAGKGAGGDNQCAGQGSCATYEHHTCGGQNGCKGQGGCGANPGENECRGMGGCAVPLMEGAWETLREKLEAQFAAEGKELGAAPPAAEG